MKVTTLTLLTAAFAVSTASAQTLTAYYDFEGTGADRFDDPAGDFADDLVGQYNPAFSSDVAAATGGTQSASFDGDSALFTDAYTTDLGPDPDAFTIMFWVKAEDILQENNSTRLATSRVRPDGSTTNDARSWQVEGFGDPDNNDGIPDNDGTNGDAMDVRYQSSPGLYPQNWFSPDATNALARADQSETAEWRHVAFVLSNSGDPGDGGAYGETYVDGVSVGLSGMHEDWDGNTLENIGGQLIIGGHAETAGNRAFVGLLDDFALFAGVVSASDIADIFAGTLSPADFLGSGIPGDTDGDGDIDDSDLGTSFSNYTGPVGAAGGKTAAEGDTDGDGDVDDSDLGTSFSGYTGPLGPASVPEPTSLALLGLGGLAMIRRRRA